PTRSSMFSVTTSRAIGSRPSRPSPMRRAPRINSSSCPRSSNSPRMELTTLSVAEVQQKLRAKEVSSAEVVRALEGRIAQIDPQIHGYLSRDFDAALKQAESADVSLPLGGVPIAIKDVINVTGEPCTAASKILLGYRSNYD